MAELKRCSGHKRHWECADKYPDHMVPVSEFGKDSWSKDGIHHYCKACGNYGKTKRHWANCPKHPATGEWKMNWKSSYAESLGGTRGTPGWQPLLDEAEVVWGMEVSTPMIPKFKSKKPKFNQGQYKSSPNTPRDSTKEVVPQEGPGDVYIFEDIMKMPGLKKIGTTTDVGKRLQSGDTWGAFTCLYTKEFKRRFEAEAKVHELLDDYRVYRNKEWFKINTALAIKTIEGMYELP